MKLVQVLSIVVIIILSGCNADNNKTYHSSIPSSFFSDVEGSITSRQLVPLMNKILNFKKCLTKT